MGVWKIISQHLAKCTACFSGWGYRPLDAAPPSTSVTSRILSSFSTESILTYTFYFYWVGKHPKSMPCSEVTRSGLGRKFFFKDSNPYALCPIYGIFTVPTNSP